MKPYLLFEIEFADVGRAHLGRAIVPPKKMFDALPLRFGEAG
jgi:hypothetical protein